MDKKRCEEHCDGYGKIGVEACLGCAGRTDYDRVEAIRKELAAKKEQLKLMGSTIMKIAGIELRADGRCKHGLMPGQCSYCAGMPMTKYAQSVGAAWVRF